MTQPDRAIASPRRLQPPTLLGVLGLTLTLLAQTTPAPPIPLAVTINGQPTLPAPGSTAGVWFYATPPPGAQLLLTGHPSVPGSWRLAASLYPNDEVHLTLGPASNPIGTLTFERQPLSPAPLSCDTASNTLILRAHSEPAALRLHRLAADRQPLAFAPQRRPFSRAPIPSSPDLHPAIAEALVEWDWRLQDGLETPREPRTCRQAIDRLLSRTEALVADRERSHPLLPAQRTAWTHWRDTARHPAPDTASEEALWLALHHWRRDLMRSHPLFPTNPILLVKHVPSVMSHQLTQAYGYCARPGGGLFALREPGRTMRTDDLTPPSLPAGNFMTPELSFDARKLYFAYCPVPEAPPSWDFNDLTRNRRYHLFELDLGHRALRPLTRGDTDNFSPVALPSGDLLFLSTRRGGYHRCGRGPCFVYTLARMRPDGRDPQTLSFHETHEWDPCLLNDGRVVYTRWDYVDRNAVHYQQLWACLPDGRNARIYYGNNTWNPTGLWEARAIPGSTRIIATAAPHHGLSAGSIVLLDTDRGVDGPDPITRLTPDVRFPESESPLAFGPDPNAHDFDTPPTQFWRGPFVDPAQEPPAPEEERRWPGHCYKSPWPLSESLFLVSYSYDRLVGEPGPNLPNMFGLYLADAFGNKELLYRDPALSRLWARRPPPPAAGAPPAPEGTFFVHNVAASWPSLPAHLPIRQLRVIQVLLKTTPHADNPRVGAAFAAPGKQVLGTVPVEPDGSAYFRAPARTPVLFQAHDDQGRAGQTKPSRVDHPPGENQSCNGCHDHRHFTAAPTALPLALQRPPSSIHPGPDGSRPFSYPRLVQPVLDQHCVRCHDGKEPDRPVLTGEPEAGFTKSYLALAPHVAFSAWGRPDRNHEPLTEPLRFGALASPLHALLEQGHGEVELTPADRERLDTWMDANALFYGTFDPAEQQKQQAGQAIQAPRE